MASSGFLDTAGSKRTYRQFSTFWNARYSALRTQQLAADDKSVYGCRMHHGKGWKTPRYHLGEGTFVFAQDHAQVAAVLDMKLTPGPTESLRTRYEFQIPKESFRWQTQLPPYANSAVLAGDDLFVVGRHDRTVDDMVQVMEQKGEGVLVRLSAADGKAGAPVPLPTPPITDGLIAASNRLFVSLQNNMLVCLKTQSDR